MKSVEIKVCPNCRRPYLADKQYCPSCPEPYTWNQESYANLGCLVLTILPLFFLVLFWLFMLFGVLFR